MGTPDPDGAARERERPCAEDGELPGDARLRRVDLGDGVACGRDDPDGGRRGEDASGPELAGREEHRRRHAAGCRVDPETVESSWFCTHTEPWPTVTPFGRPPTRVSPVTVFVAGSIQQAVAEDVDRPDRAEAGCQPDHGPAGIDPGHDRARLAVEPGDAVQAERDPDVAGGRRQAGGRAADLRRRDGSQCRSAVGDPAAAGARSAAARSSSRIDLVMGDASCRVGAEHGHRAPSP